VIAGNTAAYGAGGGEIGGGGGGISLYDSLSNITQSTIADNVLGGGQNLQGQGVIATNPTGPATVVNMAFCIIANQINSLSPTAAAIDVFAGNTINFTLNLFANNSNNTNANGMPHPGGTFNGLNSNISAASAGFVSSGSPNFNYNLTQNSPAVNAATGSPSTVDITGAPRSGVPDLGAYEFQVPPPPIPVGDSIGVFDPGSANWYLRTKNNAGAPDAGQFAYGGSGWKAISGDWDGNGTTTIGVVDPTSATFYLRNSNTPGGPDAGKFAYGLPGWIPIAGDWNGDGVTSIGMFDPSSGTWYLRNENSAGAADAGTFAYGLPGWIPVVGDWTGSGRDGIGVVDPTTGTWYLRNETSAGGADAGTFAYGLPGWIPVTGDWNNTGSDKIGMVDPTSQTWYIRFAASGGAVSLTPFAYGLPGWTPVSGKWTGMGGFQEQADPSVFSGFSVDQLNQGQLNAIVAGALARLRQAGVDPYLVSQLSTLNFQVANLPGRVVGLTNGRTITLDINAAGRGWFVDPTPLSDAEFSNGQAIAGSAASGKMDLLTVVLHEMANAAGVPETNSGASSLDLTSNSLTPGLRRTQALDAVFSQGSFSGS
jgi:hypothetical protein